MKKSIVTILALTAFVSCNNAYLAHDFEARTANHRVVAVLPVNVVYTGNLPKDMTAQTKKEVEAAESKLFQKEMYNDILRKQSKGYRVDFQPVESTNELLAKNNISAEESFTKSPTDLAKILGVDAVVRTSIRKQRFMSDFASYGIELGSNVLDLLLNQSDLKIPLPNNNEAKVGETVPDPTTSGNPMLRGKTYAISSDAQLLDGKSGVSLWNNAIRGEADWQWTDKQLVDYLTNRHGRRFPYKR